MVFQTYSARLVRSTPLTNLTKHLDFEIQGVPRFGFVPRQWLSVKHILPDGEELIRAYSIASPPSENGRVAFCVNRVQDGLMSHFLCDMKDGEELRCQGPFGNFILHPPMRDTIFIATGTGIAPIRSICTGCWPTNHATKASDSGSSSATAQRKTSTTTTDSCTLPHCT